MSSKRKNTPTKLAKDEVVIQREKIEQCSDGDSNCDSDSDSDSSLSLHIVSKPEQLDELHDSDCPGSERPQSKKQRILQSVQCSGQSDSESESSYMNHNNNNNNNMTKSSSGPIRKSMDTVLRKLSSKQTESAVCNLKAESPGESVEVMDNIKAAIGAEGSLKDKERRLSDMIAQLQAMKESLIHNTEVCIVCYTIFSCKNIIIHVIIFQVIFI